MLKKYKLYKSGKTLVTGIFVAGAIALAGVSQVHADTTTQTSTDQVVQTVAANPTATTTDATATQPVDTPTTKPAPVTSTTPASSSATSASTESPVTGTDGTTNNVSDVSAPQTASTPNTTSTAPQTPTANTASAVSPGTTAPVSAVTPAPAQSVTTTPQTVATPDITVQGQGQNYGWQNPVHENETAGVTGQALRLEGVKITVNNTSNTYPGDIVYQAHVSGTGWQSEVKNGALAGTVGQARQMEAIKIHLTGELANQYDIYYRVHIQDFGWLDWASNGTVAGSTGLGLRLEAIQFLLNLKQQTFTQSTQRPSVGAANLQYQVQGQDYGWQGTRNNDTVAGTTGQGKRLEAIKIYLDNNGLTGHVVYQAHVSGTGWQNAVTDGQLAGTVGQSRQMEAIKVTLTGQLASYYNLYYRVHIQDVGWLAWTANDGIAGSTGLAKRIEAIQLTLIQKGHAVPQTGTAYLNPTNYQVVTKHANQPVYFSQLDSRWANHPFNDYTMGPAGCVPTSIAMVLNGSYGIPVNPDNVRAVMNNISTSSYGATGIDLINTVHYYGRQVEQINTVARTAQLLQQGVPVIFYVNVANGIGHAIATYGYSNGATQVYDPYSRYYFNGWYDLNYLSNTLSRDPADWNAGRPVFAIM